MTFNVKLHPEAMKFLEGLKEKKRDDIKKSLFSLKEDPFTKRPKADIKKLKGTKGRHDFYRLRVADYRFIYAVEGRDVLITDVIKRKTGYKTLNLKL